jgi:hypothetical protein
VLPVVNKMMDLWHFELFLRDPLSWAKDPLSRGCRTENNYHGHGRRLSLKKVLPPLVSLSPNSLTPSFLHLFYRLATFFFSLLSFIFSIWLVLP